MHSKIKKLTSLSISAVLLASTLAACGGNEVNDDPNTEDSKLIYVQMYEGGYGVNWMQEIAKDFEAAYAEDGYEVRIAASPSLVYSQIESRLKAGPKINTTDLFLGGNVNMELILSQGSSYVSGYECALADLSDLYNSPVYGETTLYKDKLNQQCVTKNEWKGKYYSTNWGGGPLGFVYNSKFFTDNGWKKPNTTDELISVISEMKGDGYTPFVWCGTTASYWSYAVLPWWRQLSSDEEVERFWQCIDEDGNLTADVFKSQSRLQAYELLEKCVGTMSNSYSKSMTVTHIEAQMLLYDTSNKIVMMPSGDWVENEMEINGYPRKDSTIDFMRIPVASDAIYQYDEYGQKSFRFQTVQSDEKLSQVIAAVDEGKTSVDGVSEEDFDAIKKLRSYTDTVAYIHNAFIPAYANAKVGAKKFLAYLASDAALQKYYDLTGCFLPYDNSGVQLKTDATTFQKSLYSTMQNVSFVSEDDSKYKIFYATELQYNYEWPEAKIGTTEATERMTGREYWQYVYDYYSANFNTYVALAK